MSNIENMRRQFRTMGATFDWEAEVVTADPDYYRWNQWLFLRFLKAGLAYRADVAGRLVPQRRDARPRAGRGRRPPLLALRRAGREARPGPVVSRGRPSTPTSCSTSAASTGRSRSRPSRRTGSADPRAPRSSSRPRPTSTSRAATSCACSRPGRTRCSGRRSWSSPPSIRSSPQLTAPGSQRAEVDAYVAQARAPDRDRPAVDRSREDRRRASGADAINPINGERIPIFIADYVLAGYGTGAIMAVPAHDERDFAFAQRSGCRSGGSWRRSRGRRRCADGRRRSSPTPADEVLVNSGPYDGHARRRGRQGDRRASWPRRGKGRADGHLPPARLADQPPALLGHADPGHLLRARRHRAGARRGPAGPPARDGRLRGQRREPAEPRRGVPERDVPGLRRPRPARDRHDGHVHRLVLVLVSATCHRTKAGGPIDRALVDAGRRSTSTPAAPSTRSCTCCTPASGRR